MDQAPAPASTAPRGPGDLACSALLLALLVPFFLPELFLGRAISPHHNSAYLRAAAPAAASAEPLPGTQRFSDVFCLFVPQLALAFRDEGRSWLTTLDPYAQLGMPARAFLYSEAFPPTFLLEQLASDPLRAYTLLAILGVFLTLFGAYGWCRALGHTPVAALAAAATAGFALRTIFWLQAAQYVYATAFTLIVLALATWTLRRPTAARLALVALAVFWLLLTGRKQLILFDGWFVAAFVLYRALRESPPKQAAARLALLGGAALAGALLALPSYVDLYLDTRASVRGDVAEEFLSGGMARFNPFLAGGTLAEKARFVIGLLEPYWLGNPLLDEAAFGRFMGTAFTAPCALALGFGLARSRDRWFFGLTLLAAILGSLWLPAYELAATRLGGALSRYWLLDLAVLPLAPLTAAAVTGAPCGGRGRFAWPLAWLAVLAAAYLTARSGEGGARGGPALLALLAFLATAAAFGAGRTRLVAAVLALLAAAYALPVKLSRPQHTIVRASPLTAALAGILEPGQRFVVLAPPGRHPLVLFPNQSTALGLASVHFYDPLASHRATAIAARLGFDPGEYRRAFDVSFDPRTLDSATARRARVDVVLAAGVRFDGAGFREVGRHADVVLWKRDGGAPEVEYLGPDGAASRPTQVRSRRPDHWQGSFESFPADGTVVFSRQYLRSWRARVDGRPAAVEPFDDLFLAVRVPAGGREIEIEYLPYARWLWISHVASLALVLLAAGGGLKERRRRDPRRLSPRDGATELPARGRMRRRASRP